MIKVTLFLLGVFHLYLNAMEGCDTHEPSQWRSRTLTSLLEESKWPTCTQWNQSVREVKKAFVDKYLDKYEEQQQILNRLASETNGVIRFTTDPELAKEDSNKFLCLDVLQCTAEEIDARWERIHHVDCKYIGLRSSNEKKETVKEQRGPLHDIPGMLPPS